MRYLRTAFLLSVLGLVETTSVLYHKSVQSPQEERSIDLNSSDTQSVTQLPRAREDNDTLIVPSSPGTRALTPSSDYSPLNVSAINSGFAAGLSQKIWDASPFARSNADVRSDYQHFYEGIRTAPSVVTFVSPLDGAVTYSLTLSSFRWPSSQSVHIGFIDYPPLGLDSQYPGDRLTVSTDTSFSMTDVGSDCVMPPHSQINTLTGLLYKYLLELELSPSPSSDSSSLYGMSSVESLPSSRFFVMGKSSRISTTAQALYSSYFLLGRETALGGDACREVVHLLGGLNTKPESVVVSQIYMYVERMYTAYAPFRPYVLKE